MVRVILLELNEINFEAVRAYSNAGELPELTQLLEAHGMATTVSETKYEYLEPWIQWVTAHTGLSLSEHGVFRLGDIVKHDLEQIWERIEQNGISVGAVSPMNAKNRTANARFFVPDPWTNTEVTGSFLLRKLYGAIAQAVNDNSQSRLELSSVFWLIAGALVYARPRNYARYLRLVVTARKKPWNKAMFLDLLLADVFITLTRNKRPGFASLFVNSGAHIQHHYMFNSTVYSGGRRNPAWYVDEQADPVLEVYKLYDGIVADIRDRFPDARLMIATGLHQDPHPELTYYWRLRNHAEFLRRHEVPFVDVEPRMSRDFLIHSASQDDAAIAAEILESAESMAGDKLFYVDNRGSEIFAMLVYPGEIDDSFEFRLRDRIVEGLRDDVAFVAIKNGSHNGLGYFVDTGERVTDSESQFPLAELPSRVLAALP